MSCIDNENTNEVKPYLLRKKVNNGSMESHFVRTEEYGWCLPTIVAVVAVPHHQSVAIFIIIVINNNYGLLQ
jgi:hypothetical protein